MCLARKINVSSSSDTLRSVVELALVEKTQPYHAVDPVLVAPAVPREHQIRRRLMMSTSVVKLLRTAI